MTVIGEKDHRGFTATEQYAHTQQVREQKKCRSRQLKATRAAQTKQTKQIKQIKQSVKLLANKG